MKLTGNLVINHGFFIAPGGARHGTSTISTRDVAELMYAAATYAGTDNRLIEAGGPEWLTWGEIAQIIAQRVGRKRVRVVPVPAWMARFNQLMARPFSSSIANNFALMSFVATHQPRWEAAKVVQELGAPKQLSVSDYLDARMEDWKSQQEVTRMQPKAHKLDNRIPPPVVTLATGIAMWLLSFISPATHLDRNLRIAGGGGVIALGFCFLALGFLAFRKARTTIDPVRIDRASSVVSNGIFGWTRNPMYVGFTAILLGWALYLASPIAAIGPIAFALFTTRFQIIPEERVMLAKFGDGYERYRNSVRRWL